MAPRGRSLTASEHAYSDRSNDSSPDPLAISFDENITSSPRKSSPRKPMLASSPNKPGRRPGPSEMVFSSPSKSMVLSTPRGNGASPWRIKVTVQAEPEDGENAESPSVKRVTRTRTTTVPLKDPDASSPVKRPRGRPRKSETGSTPKPKRKATPIKRPAQFSSPAKVVGGGDSSAADVDTDIPPRKRRGRPRKSVEPSHYEENTAVERPETTPESPREETPLPSVGERSRSSEKGARFAEPSRPDLQTMDDALRTSPTRSEPSPSLGTPAQSSLRNSIRERRGTPHANRVAILESDEDDDGAVTPPSGDDDDDLPEVQPLGGLDDDPQGALTPSETSAQSSNSDDDASNAAGDVGAQDVQDYEDDDRDDETQGQKLTFDEGTTRMPDDTTMLDGTFSMISVESLRNNVVRPSPPKPQSVQTATASKAGSSLRHEYLGPTTHVASEPERSTRNEQVSTAQVSTETASTDPGRPKLSRHVTPAMDWEVPTAPPALQPVQPAPTKSPSPTLGRAVTAGVALQGLLDPNRLTPDASQKTPDAKRGSLDDLFRGFSSGTRKDLQAGLRLGEQLAQGQTEEDIAPGRSSPIRAQPTAAAPKAGVFRTKRKYQQSRLLTPEDQDHVVTATGPAVAAGDVQYPALDIEESDKTPMSPARSESAMSWRADTPPRAAGNQAQLDVDMEEARKDIASPVEEELVQHDDFGDIWQEEASRSMISTHPEEPSAERSPEVQDLFTDASVVRPARGRVARTWRRKKANEGIESRRREPAPERTESDTQQSKDNEDNQKVGSAQPEEQHMQTDKPNIEGEESDDAGMFFKSDVPSVSNQKRPAQFQRRRPRRQEAEKVSLSELLDQGESFVPESSPPTTTQKTPPKKTPPKAMANPFLDMPPRFAAIMSSPKKSSPLRRELHSGDISTSSVQQFEESTLPLAQSSPFHTVVDGDSKISAASDQQQFRMEMEGNTASTIIRVREEANEYLDAYEPQERSLNDIVEVTEMSRTHQDISQLPSSPPKMQQRFEQRLLSARKPSPLSKTAQRSDDASTAQPRRPLVRAKQPEVIELSSGSSSSEESETSPSVVAQPAPQPAVTLTAKSTSSRLPEPQSQLQPQPHPILSRMTPLPKVEPWTRTHYKALDKLYSTHLKHPALFCPFNVPPTPLSRTNGHLLRRFLAENGNLPYVGAVFHAWGYSMVMTAELVVLCSVFMELMSLGSEFEYEQVAGRKLEIGNCAPGRRGDWISGEDVLQRLATVVMGESVRRDERAGREIDRSRSLYIEWPQTAGRS